MINQSQEKIFYNYVRTRPELFDIIDKEFFSDVHLKFCYKYDVKYFKKYHRLPTSAQLNTILETKKVTEFFDDDKNFNSEIVNKIFNLNIDEYDEVWLKENFTAWVEFKNLDTSVFEVISYLKQTNITVENIKDVVATVKEIIVRKNSIIIDDAEGLDLYSLESHIQPKEDKFTTGYSWFDKILGGGFSKKTLVAFAGRAKTGKSLVLGNFAARCIKNGFNCAYITLELSEKKVLKRISSNLFSVKYNDYDSFVEKQNLLKDRLERFKIGDGMTTIPPGCLKIKEFPAGTASTLEIESYLVKMEDVLNLKFNLVVIDYLGIMKNWRNPNTENLYVKGKQISEDLRAMAQRNNWTVLTATQINRQGATSSHLTMSDISESMAIVHTVDALIGINNRDIVDRGEDTISFTPLALRDADNKSDDAGVFDLDFDYMRFSEKLENSSSYSYNPSGNRIEDFLN